MLVLRLALPMDAQTLPVHEAAATTGWSARMLRYLERVGLAVPPRTAAGYRVYGAAELQRLRTLRELLADHGIALSDVAFAKRLRDDPKLSESIADWLEAKPHKPTSVPNADWLTGNRTCTRAPHERAAIRRRGSRRRSSWTLRLAVAGALSTQGCRGGLR